MIPVTAEQLADIVGGDLLDPDDADAVVDDVVIDSRRARPGSLFVALPGERTDGHAFVADARSRGAAACLVDETRLGELPDDAGAIAVDDCADALLGLGAWVRDTADPTVVAVTGSSGKTTTKDLIAAAVTPRYAPVAPEGSFNNELGVPLTCCRLDLGSELLVAEVGARGVGHVAALAAILRPDVAVVTTVSGAHLEFFGSVEAVAQAKGELVEALTPAGVAVLNADDPRVAALANRTPGRVVTYGMGDEADWRATDVELDELGRARFRVRGVEVALPLPGEHNVGNALAALAVADTVGVRPGPAAGALRTARVSRWRMEVVPTRSGVTILNDAYNANPASMAAALRTLASTSTGGRRWAVLGRMAELGDGSAAEHERIGRLAADLGIDGVVAVGPEARPIAAAAGPEAFAVDDPAAAVAALRGRLEGRDVVLVKASRAAGLELVADGLLTLAGGEA